MRLRTKTLPRSDSVSRAFVDGAQLGAVMANALALPPLYVMFWMLGLTWFGMLFFGAWVFAMTLWARAYGFAFRLEYEPPKEEP